LTTVFKGHLHKFQDLPDPVETKVVMMGFWKCEDDIQEIPPQAVDIPKPDPCSESNACPGRMQFKDTEFPVFPYEMVKKGNGMF